MLKQTGIIKDKSKAEANDVFTNAISPNFLEIPKMKSSEYVAYCWEKFKKYCENVPNAKNLNGQVFEIIIQTEMFRQSLFPMYIQAQVAFVPNVNFDVLFYTRDRYPIGISLKTSLRERYKQADLEAVALKYVHRKALNFLITLHESEARKAKEKSENGEMLGLDNIIIATKDEFDELVNQLTSKKYIMPEKIDIITAKNIVTSSY